jgi:hypothetical protein
MTQQVSDVIVTAKVARVACNTGRVWCLITKSVDSIGRREAGILPEMRAAAVSCSLASSLMTKPLITRAKMRFLKIIFALPSTNALAGGVTRP